MYFLVKQLLPKLLFYYLFIYQHVKKRLETFDYYQLYYTFAAHFENSIMSNLLIFKHKN